jgi:ribose 5-phosphate isomerase A
MRAERKQKLTEQQIAEAKKAAATEACKLIQAHSIIGLGSGTTMEYLAEELGRRNKNGDDIKVIPTSYEMILLAKKYDVPILNINSISALRLAIDGADELDLHGNAIKGGGGAQTTEKIVASLAEEYVLIVDESKLVETLGKRMPVPVEVLPSALELVLHRLEGFDCKVTLRTGTGKVGPVITDIGNIILDVHFAQIKDCRLLDRQLNNIPGVAGHGLFAGMVDKAIVGFIDKGIAKTKVQNFQKDKYEVKI